MGQNAYAKVVITANGPTFEQYRQRLEALADPAVDVGLLQVGVYEAVLRPHLLRHLVARTGVAADTLLTRHGAARVEMISADDVAVLARQRIPEELQVKAPSPVHDGWHLDAVNAGTAWDAVGGPDAIAWGDVCVGQIDTGYTQHVAFGHGAGEGGGTSWIRSAACRTILFADVPAEFGIVPQVSAGNGVDPMPFGAMSKGHGTRIGSTISGWARLPAGGTFHGVAPKVPHVVVRITDSVAINTRQAEFIHALDYLVSVVKVDVVNVSLGAFPPVASKAMVDSLATARAKGVIVVCAAGNYVDPVVVPACVRTAIAVGGVSPYLDGNGTLQMRPWSGSSFGPEVAFSAPADQIHRAAPQRNGIGSNFDSGGDGTSYAAAIASGSAALWLLRWRPQINAMYGRTAKRVEAFKAAVQATCQQPPNWQPQPFGAGVVDVGRLCTEMENALPLIPGSFPIPAVPAAVEVPHG
jgi:hypothetical protein